MKNSLRAANASLDLAIITSVFLISSCATPTGDVKTVANIVEPLSSSVSFPVFTLAKTETKPGGIILVRAELDKPQDSLRECTAKTPSMTAPFFPSKPGNTTLFEAVLAVDYFHEPGTLDISVECTQVNHVEARLPVHLPIHIEEAAYGFEKIRVARRYVSRHIRRVSFSEDAQPTPEAQQVPPHLIEEKLWDEPFQLPMDSQITSPFGTRRIFNGRLQSYHSGVDFHASPGTAVHASARGRVIVSRSLFLTGKTVILDHGFGIRTLYAHLSRILVKPGQLVDAGMLIARSGRTGRVRGAHLHWGASIQGVKVDPMELVELLR